MNSKTIFSVRYRDGAHQTQTVHGQRASSTSSYEEAARMLARKLHPHQAWELTPIRSECALQVFALAVTP